MKETKKIISVIGPYLFNDGDFMMLHCIIEQLKNRYQMVLGKHHRNYHEIPSDGTGLLVDESSINPLKHYLTYKWMPKLLREKLKIYYTKELNVLLDCSGFQYGDQFEKQFREKEKRLEMYKGLVQNGTKIVFMPQAYGPFENSYVRDISRKILELADLRFARDTDSLGYLKGLNLDHGNTELASDITVLLKGKPPADREVWKNRVAIVPNSRMLDQTSKEVSDQYYQFNHDLIGIIRKNGYEPYFLIHEQYDKRIAQRLNDQLESKIQVYRLNPVKAKGTLGSSFAVISSRYHAIISSLTSGVPSFATTWSHKYNCLLKEYRIEENLLSPLMSHSELEGKLSVLFDPKSRQSMINKINTQRKDHEKTVNEMWNKVYNFVEK